MTRYGLKPWIVPGLALVLLLALHSSGRWLQRENGQEFPGTCQLSAAYV